MATNPNPAVPRREREVLGDRVFRILGAAIRDGRLRPGQAVRDVDLARDLGVSRTPVREALQRLERLGMIEISANRYTRVTEVTDADRASTREYFVVMMGTALSLATRHASDEELAVTLRSFDAMVAAAGVEGDPDLGETGTRFYRDLTLVTHNALFVRAIADASWSFQRNLAGWIPFLPAPSVRAHVYEELRAAIARRDGTAAQRIFRAQHDLT